jgi:hypothetical protein
MKATADFVSCLNAITLEEDDVIEAIRVAIDAYDSGECHLMTGVITTMQLFATAPQKARAVIFRLQALAIMMENDELKNWIQRGGTAVVPAAQKALISAVADHPLSLINGDVSFEKESFLRRILESAEPQGNQEN